MDTDSAPNGKRDRRHVSSKTREVVLAKVSALERERAERTGPPEPGDPIDTVGDWIGYWLKYIAARRAKARTVRSYGLVMHREVLPRVGPVRLSDLREHHLDWLYGSMLAGGATVAGLRDVRRVLSAALNEAVARELVARNVARRAAIPRYKSPEVEPLTVHETQRIFAAAANMPNGAAWVVALALGLRRAEVLGLHWNDVDLEAGTISIRPHVDVLHEQERSRRVTGVVQTRIADSGSLQHRLRKLGVLVRVERPAPVVAEHQPTLPDAAG